MYVHIKSVTDPKLRAPFPKHMVGNKDGTKRLAYKQELL